MHDPGQTRRAADPADWTDALAGVTVPRYAPAPQGHFEVEERQ